MGYPGFTSKCIRTQKSRKKGKQGAGPKAVLGVGGMESASNLWSGGCPAGHLLEGQGGLVPILACEVVVHAEVCLAAQLVPRGTVGDTLNHSTLGRKGQVLRPAGMGSTLPRLLPRGTYPGGGGYHPVGEDEEVQANQLEDVLEEVNNLQSQHVLEARETQRCSMSVL